MFQRLADRLTKELGYPKKGLLGWFVKSKVFPINIYLEEKAVILSKIESHHKVLELGFGPGFGLLYASDKIQAGVGKLYGVEISNYMLDDAKNRLQEQIKDGRVELTVSAPATLPFPDNFFDRVFHVNCYYFWKDPDKQAKEILRTMKTGSMMVTTFNLDIIRASQGKGLFINGANPDYELHMRCLQRVGFKNVIFEELIDSKSGQKYQTISACAEK